MANSAMVDYWNGPASQHWVRTPERYDAMLADLGRLALDAAGLSSGERVLDVGCGSGQLAAEAARRVGPSGRVTGVDISAPLLQLGRTRVGDVPQVELVQADAQLHAFEPAGYDAVVSRFGVMFFDDPVAAFANLRRATRPQGRLAFVAWQGTEANGWITLPMTALGSVVPPPPAPAPGAPGPTAFDDPDHVRAVLARSGWSDVVLEGVTTTVLVGGPASAEDVVAFYLGDGFVRRALADASPEEQLLAEQALHDAVAAAMGEDGLRLPAGVWLVTATA